MKVLNFESIKSSKIFIVGAGGIGCELLKNVVLTGFKDIHIIDLDTIEVSNLNRQFLFQREHVGKSKALVARESIIKYRPHLNIIAYHDSITESKYDVNFYKQFDLVFSALDNIAVRYHLNRMCLAANVVLIESGTQGFLGQIKPIFKGKTECYDCLPRISGKTQYASCTIRNTPTEPVHCIVWAKNLFNVLFGSESDEDSISPEITVESSNSTDDNKNEKNESESDISKNTAETNHHLLADKPLSTHAWALLHKFEAKAIAQKLYQLDIEYLLGMKDLWKKRTAPKPITQLFPTYFTTTNDSILTNYDNGPSFKFNIDNNEDIGNSTEDLQPQSKKIKKDNNVINNVENQHRQVWSLEKCFDIFETTTKELHEKLEKLIALKKMHNNNDDTNINNNTTEEKSGLSWDKDDNLAINFVAAAANIRCYIFGITPLTLFDIKSIAGNIIPAISTTNAIVAGLIVAQACYILSDQAEKCRTLFLRTPNENNFKNTLIGREELKPPNPKCFSCAPKPQVFLKINLETFTLAKLIQVLKQDLHMSQPDVTIDDGKGTVLISSEVDDEEVQGDSNMTQMLSKPLSAFNLHDGNRLLADDFSQSYELVIVLVQFVQPPPNDQNESNVLEHDTKVSEKSEEYVLSGDLDTLKTQKAQNEYPEQSTSATHQDVNENEPDDIQEIMVFTEENVVEEILPPEDTQFTQDSLQNQADNGAEFNGTCDDKIEPAECDEIELIEINSNSTNTEDDLGSDDEIIEEDSLLEEEELLRDSPTYEEIYSDGRLIYMDNLINNNFFTNNNSIVINNDRLSNVNNESNVNNFLMLKRTSEILTQQNICATTELTNTEDTYYSGKRLRVDLGQSQFISYSTNTNNSNNTFITEQVIQTPQNAIIESDPNANEQDDIITLD